MTIEFSDDQKAMFARLLDLRVQHAERVDAAYRAALMPMTQEAERILYQGGDFYAYLIAEMIKHRDMYAAAVQGVVHAAEPLGSDAALVWRARLAAHDRMIVDVGKSGFAAMNDWNEKFHETRMEVLEKEQELADALNDLRRRYAPY